MREGQKMEKLKYVDRRNTKCDKWDAQTGMFGEEGLHAMWVADMDFEGPQCVKEALREYVEQGVYGYYAIPDSYYQSFMNWELKHHRLELKQEWIRFTPGVVAAFHWFVQMFSKESEAVMVTTPVYYPFLHAVQNNHRKLIESDLVIKDGTYVMDYEDIERKIVENDVKAFILCSPHNPVGRVWKKEELKKLFDICKKYGVYVISDEIHQDLVFGENKHMSSLLVGDYDDIMVAIKAPSKTFNLAGGQNAFVVIPDEKIRAMWDQYILGNRVKGGSAFGYIAAEAAYTGGEEWLESLLKQVDENFHYLKDELAAKLPEASVTELEGTYLAWVDLGAYVSVDGMKDWVQKRARLAVDYGEWFGGERFGTHIRINLATSLENVKIAVDALVENK